MCVADGKWIELAQGRDHWLTFVNTVMNSQAI